MCALVREKQNESSAGGDRHATHLKRSQGLYISNKIMDPTMHMVLSDIRDAAWKSGNKNTAR